MFAKKVSVVIEKCRSLGGVNLPPEGRNLWNSVDLSSFWRELQTQQPNIGPSHRPLIVNTWDPAIYIRKWIFYNVNGASDLPIWRGSEVSCARCLCLHCWLRFISDRSVIIGFVMTGCGRVGQPPSLNSLLNLYTNIKVFYDLLTS